MKHVNPNILVHFGIFIIFYIYVLYFYNLIHYSSQGSASPRLIPAKQLTQQSVRIKYVRTCRELGRSVEGKNLVRSGFLCFFEVFWGSKKNCSECWSSTPNFANGLIPSLANHEKGRPTGNLSNAVRSCGCWKSQVDYPSCHIVQISVMVT